MQPRRIRKLLVSAAVAAVTAGVTTPSEAAAPLTITRLAGSDRYETAAAISAATFAPSRFNMVVARGDDFADALVASYLAGSYNGGAPILLTARDHIPESVLQEARRLGVQLVFIIGDQEVISAQAENELRAVVHDVQRIAGPDRFETARRVAATAPEPGNTAYVASGRSFADALAAGPEAYAFSRPLFLTERDQLPASTRQAILESGVSNVVVLGGTNAVSAEVENAIASICTPQPEGTHCVAVRRIAGADRFATATQVADDLANLLGTPITQITLARGDTFPDAIAASPHGGEALAPTVFTAGPDDLGATTRAWLQQHASTITTVHVLGDAEAVSDTVVNEVRSILSSG